MTHDDTAAAGSLHGAPGRSAGGPGLLVTFDWLLAGASRLASSGGRRILGIVGAPGAGKSTVCAALTRALHGLAAPVGMDGFHLANAELDRLGRRGRKGAPDTFDVDGYVALLGRLHDQQEPVVYAPAFDRGLEEPIGSAVAIRRETPLVITEGNYLLLQEAGWQRVRPLLDEVWFLETAEVLRRSRLISRRRSFGEDEAAACQWVDGVDARNAATVEACRDRADVVLHLPDLPIPRGQVPSC